MGIGDGDGNGDGDGDGGDDGWQKASGVLPGRRCDGNTDYNHNPARLTSLNSLLHPSFARLSVK